MTKEEARSMLNEYIALHYEQWGYYNLPITDEVVKSKMTSETIPNMEPNKVYVAPFKFEQWSFKALIKIAYDL